MKNEYKPDKGTKYKVRISENIYNKVMRISKILGVSKKNLSLFLILNRYDLIYEDIQKGNFDKIKKDLYVSYIEPVYSKENSPRYLQFQVPFLIDDLLHDLAYNLDYKVNKLIRLMLYKNIGMFEEIIDKLCKEEKVPFSICERNMTTVAGISTKDFRRLSSAFVLYKIFENTRELLMLKAFE